MDLITNSRFDEPFKLVLLKVFERSMTEVLSNVSTDNDIASLESLAAESILSLAEQGQTSPGQLQRHAVCQVKALMLTNSADKLYINRSRRQKP